jgi:hypothetical protein
VRTSVAGEVAVKVAILVLGILGVLLGGLWLLQGLGVVQIEPILCVAGCEEVQGPSTTWSIAGALLVLAGALGVFYAVIRFRAAAGR